MAKVARSVLINFEYLRFVISHIYFRPQIGYNRIMNNLTQMPNIGKTLAERLKDAGISSADELKKIGSKVAFMRLKLHDPDSCLNKLFALEGAVQGIRWHNLSAESKAELKKFFNSL